MQRVKRIVHPALSYAGPVTLTDLEPPTVSFASDNSAGVLPEVLEAIARANAGHAGAYGADAWTRRAELAFAELFGRPVRTLFTFSGTGANVVGLGALLRPWEAVVCPTNSHINTDECGAPERFTGAKLIDVPCPDGKLRPEQIEPLLWVQHDVHHVQPRVVSITQSTEFGTLYTADEIAALADHAHAHGMLLHVDGARVGNAAAALGGDVRSFTVDAGVDVMSFGGTKNGLLAGEAVLFFDAELARHAHFVQKQAAQLPSKQRYLAAQFEALLTDGLWLRSARHANAMAARLAGQVERLDGVRLARRPEVNAVFAHLPKEVIPVLQDWSFFWTWDENTDEVRWMCSFDTTEQDVERFVAGVQAALAAAGR